MLNGDGFPDIVTSQEGSGYYYSPALALSSFSTTQVLAYDRNLNPIRSWAIDGGQRLRSFRVSRASNRQF